MISATITNISVQDNVTVSYDLLNDQDPNYSSSETQPFALYPQLTDISNFIQSRVNQLETAFQTAMQEQQQQGQQQPPDYSPLQGQQITSQ